MVLTCRVLSYQDKRIRLDSKDFPDFQLAPFDDDKIRGFVKGWHRELVNREILKEEKAQDLLKGLTEALRRKDLRRLAPNPLLLTVMALVHTHKERLPDARALLYEETIEVLLYRWDQIKTIGAVPRLGELLQEGRQGRYGFSKGFSASLPSMSTGNRKPVRMNHWPTLRNGTCFDLSPNCIRKGAWTGLPRWSIP